MTITISNIQKKIDNNLIIKNISFQIKKGVITCLIGQSGGGKTTVANIIAGFIHPDKGKIHIDEQDITDSDIYSRNIRVITSYPILIPYMSVIENIMFGFRDTNKITNSEKLTMARKRLTIFDILDKQNQNINSLSLEQKQIIGLCMATMDKSELLILDESLTMISAKNYHQVIQLINSDKSKRVLLITNTYDTIKSLSDHIITISNGLVVAQGSYQKLMKNPQHIDTATLLKAKNIIKYKVIYFDDNTLVLSNNNQNYSLQTHKINHNNNGISINDEITVKLQCAITNYNTNTPDTNYSNGCISLDHYLVTVKEVLIRNKPTPTIVTLEDVSNPNISLEIENDQHTSPGIDLYIKITQVHVLSTI